MGKRLGGFLAKDMGAVSPPPPESCPMKLIIQKYLARSWQTFPVKGQIVNILDLEGNMWLSLQLLNFDIKAQKQPEMKLR